MKCETCKGTGDWDTFVGKEDCWHCGGTGEVTAEQLKKEKAKEEHKEWLTDKMKKLLKTLSPDERDILRGILIS